MRIGLDATPLLGLRTGVGRYVEHLLDALADGHADDRPDDRADGPIGDSTGRARPGSPAEQTGGHTERTGPGGRDGEGGERSGDELVATAFTLRGRGQLAGSVAPGVRTRARPVPARLLQALWQRAPLPPVEWLTGRLDVFHATNFVLPPLRRAAGVVTVHDLSYLRTPETVTAASLRYRTLVPRGLARAAMVCTPSMAVAAEVREEYRLDPDRVMVTPLGVDTTWFATAPPDAAWLAGHGLPERYLLFVGSLEPRKGLPTLLTAYAQLRAEHPEPPPLILAGPPGWGPALSTAGLPPESVITTGYLAAEDLRRIVAGAAALVYPSRYEGFGLPPLEAFACGTPVVASDIPVIREVTGPHARLFPVGDTEALAAALAKTLDAGGPGTPGERRAHARGFTWARCAEATRTAYHRAAAS